MRSYLSLPLGVTASLASVALLSADAHAGGLGVFGAAGARQDIAYYYQDDGVQGRDAQIKGAHSTGFEVLLGDRDDNIQGVIRAFGVFDKPVSTPDTSSVAEEYLPVSHPDYDALDTKRTGSATVGLQWKIWGDPSKFQLVATTMMGAGFITTDNTEFAIFQPGFGATYTINERYQLVGSVNYNARFRKTLKSGGEALVGFRYMID